MIAFFDLDGTLIDISRRWYELHRSVARKHNLPLLEREPYLSMKRDGVDERKLYLALAGEIDLAALDAYLVDRVADIEEEQYLAYDTLFPGIPQVLDAWKHKYQLILLTKRKNAATAERQVNALGIREYFDDLLIGDKKRHLAAFDPSTLREAPFISDAYEDITLGKALHMCPIAVTYGCRSAVFFSAQGISDQVASPLDLLTRL
jgi:phosphoglycolate phosphatase-like HAD superfamily hydrolase